MSGGKNMDAKELIRSYVDRCENIDAQIKGLQEDKKAVLAEAKSNGLKPRGIQHVVRVRKLKPHDRQEWEIERDLYLNACGMADEPPLFRQMAALLDDTASEDQLIEAFKKLAPPKGDFIIRAGSRHMRIFRDKDGNPQAEEWVDSVPPSERRAPSAPPRPRPDTPDVDAEGAYALGVEYAKANRPVIDNPFPFGDARRGRFDEGWRHGSGSNGMGG